MNCSGARTEASKTATQTITGTVTSPDATVVGQTVTLTDNGAMLATAGDLVFHGDLNRRFRAFDAGRSIGQIDQPRMDGADTCGRRSATEIRS